VTACTVPFIKPSRCTFARTHTHARTRTTHALLAQLSPALPTLTRHHDRSNIDYGANGHRPEQGDETARPERAPHLPRAKLRLPPWTPATRQWLEFRTRQMPESRTASDETPHVHRGTDRNPQLLREPRICRFGNSAHPPRHLHQDGGLSFRSGICGRGGQRPTRHRASPQKAPKSAAPSPTPHLPHGKRRPPIRTPAPGQWLEFPERQVRGRRTARHEPSETSRRNAPESTACSGTTRSPHGKHHPPARTPASRRRLESPVRQVCGRRTAARSLPRRPELRQKSWLLRSRNKPERGGADRRGALQQRCDGTGRPG